MDEWANAKMPTCIFVTVNPKPSLTPEGCGKVDGSISLADTKNVHWYFKQ